MDHIENGIVPPWLRGDRIGKWGSPFKNQEQLLPPGTYSEYDVPPLPGVRPPGPERIVQEAGGASYWTWDQYGSFVRIR
jgi:guanyl-specific ribonuclease Sa